MTGKKKFIHFYVVSCFPDLYWPQNFVIHGFWPPSEPGKGRVIGAVAFGPELKETPREIFLMIISGGHRCK